MDILITIGGILLMVLAFIGVTYLAKTQLISLRQSERTTSQLMDEADAYSRGVGPFF